MTKGVYAGSFDPITKGHLWMIQNGAELFDELVVAIGINPDKKSTFSLDERVRMIKKATRDIPNVTIGSFQNQFLVNYASSINAGVILRGIRNEGDYGFERAMRHINSDLNPGITTAFLIPTREFSEVSSSLVKGLVGPDGWEEVIEGYITRNVYNQFLVKFGGLKSRWSNLWKRLGVNEDKTEEYKELVALYGEDTRSYHNLVHIVHTLRELDSVGHLVDNKDMLELALWYHDAIYDTRAKNNEEKSAELAIKRLGEARFNNDYVSCIENLILNTKHGKKPEDKDARYLTDIDLTILGKPVLEFDEYEKDIREEYSWVPDMQFMQGRTAVLNTILGMGTIYSTDFFRLKYGAQAQKNLERYLIKKSS